MSSTRGNGSSSSSGEGRLPAKTLVISQSKARRGDTPEVTLCARQCRLAWEVQSHPCVRMCINEITKRLFSGDGMIVTRGDETLTPSPAFASYLRRELAPFVRNAFMAINAFGVVPIAFRNGDVDVEAGAGVMRVSPYVPDFGTYTITTYSHRGQQHFRFHWGGAMSQHDGCGDNAAGVGVTLQQIDAFGEADDSVIVAHEFGASPNLDGTLNSNFAAIVENVLFHQELVRAAVTAERIASNPPVFTARNLKYDEQQRQYSANLGEATFSGSADRQTLLAGEGDDDGDDCLGNSGGGGGGLNGEDGAGVGMATYERTGREISAFQSMMEVFEARTGLRAGEYLGVGSGPGCAADNQSRSVRGSGRNPHTGYVMPWAAQFNLGAARTLVHQQMPQTRGDLVQLTRILQETVCGVLSVPRALILADSSVKAGVESTENTMNKTVQHLAEQLGDLATRVYQHLFGRVDLAEELQLRVEQKRKLLRARFGERAADRLQAADLLTERDMFEATRKTAVTIGFDLVPVTSNERLDHMYERGIITWRAYGESMLRLNGMPRTMLAHETAPPNSYGLQQQQQQPSAGKKRAKTDDSANDNEQAAAVTNDADNETKRKKRAK